MKQKRNFTSLGEASEILGDDFWEVITDILPFIGPRIDVFRVDSEMVIMAEIPGIVSPNDLTIKLQGPMLLIEGEVNRPYLDGGVKVIQDERFHGTFKRKIRLSDDCIQEKLRANYVRGLLEIRIPTFNDENSYPKTEVPVRFEDEEIIE